MKRLRQFLKESWSELKKVSWPNRMQVRNLTVLVFVISFVFNVLVAALIVYVGDQLGVGTQLSTAIIVVLGIRIFGNAAALRRRLFGA